MKLAVQAGLPGSEPYCWSKNILGQLYETTGQLDEAEKQYAGILAIRPSYAFAMAGQARVQKERKQYDKALATLDFRKTPTPATPSISNSANSTRCRGNWIRRRCTV